MEDFIKTLKNVANSHDADIFLYSGEITPESASQFIDDVHDHILTGKRKNFCLFLCTNGGDPNAGYKMAKYIKNNYEKFILYICGYCKSTGTLIALSADEIVMSAQGELGPLDTQTSKRDEIVFQSSSLDLLTAYEYINSNAQELFESNFFNLIIKSNGAITIKTAADIAGKLTTGVLSPILGQIDPLRLGEIQREIKIAYDYGMRLFPNRQIIDALIYNYPSHSFVIDLKEARRVFNKTKTIRGLNNEEDKLKTALAAILKGRFSTNHLRVPASDLFILNLNSYIREESENGQEDQNEPSTRENYEPSNNGASRAVASESHNNQGNTAKAAVTSSDEAD